MEDPDDGTTEYKPVSARHIRNAFAPAVRTRRGKRRVTDTQSVFEMPESRRKLDRFVDIQHANDFPLFDARPTPIEKREALVRYAEAQPNPTRTYNSSGFRQRNKQIFEDMNKHERYETYYRPFAPSLIMAKPRKYGTDGIDLDPIRRTTDVPIEKWTFRPSVGPGDYDEFTPS